MSVIVPALMVAGPVVPVVLVRPHGYIILCASTHSLVFTFFLESPAFSGSLSSGPPFSAKLEQLG